jgi:hypothetical protein
MGLEARSHPRELTLQTGRIQRGAQHQDIVCAVLNISNGGACILVPERAEVPQQFRLVIDYGGSHACEIVWRSGNRIGVTTAEIASEQAQ